MVYVLKDNDMTTMKVVVVVIIINTKKCNGFFKQHLVLYFNNKWRSHDSENAYIKSTYIIFYGTNEVQKVLFKERGTIIYIE